MKKQAIHTNNFFWFMVVRLSDIGSKKGKNMKNVFLFLFRAYVGQPDDHIGWATSMPLALIYSSFPRTNPWNFHEIILRIGGAGKCHFILIFCFWLLVFSNFFPNENHHGFHMRQRFFLHYEWFLLEKGFIQTNMHRIVLCTSMKDAWWWVISTQPHLSDSKDWKLKTFIQTWKEKKISFIITNFIF